MPASLEPIRARRRVGYTGYVSFKRLTEGRHSWHVKDQGCSNGLGEVHWMMRDDEIGVLDIVAFYCVSAEHGVYGFLEA